MIEYNFKILNRVDAANKLLSILPIEMMQDEQWQLLAISTGSVEIVDMMASKIGLMYDLFFTQTICAPNNKECIIAMVSETQEIVMHKRVADSFGISEDYIFGEAKRRYEKDIINYIYQYRKGEHIGSLKDKRVLLVDQGCESGMSMLCAIKSVLSLGVKKVSIAIPIMPKNIYKGLEAMVDKVYVNHKIEDFIDVEYYYKELNELTFEQIQKIIKNSNYYLPYVNKVKDKKDGM